MLKVKHWTPIWLTRIIFWKFLAKIWLSLPNTWEFLAKNLKSFQIATNVTECLSNGWEDLQMGFCTNSIEIQSFPEKLCTRSFFQIFISNWISWLSFNARFESEMHIFGSSSTRTFIFDTNYSRKVHWRYIFISIHLNSSNQ